MRHQLLAQSVVRFDYSSMCLSGASPGGHSRCLAAEGHSIAWQAGMRVVSSAGVGSSTMSCCSMACRQGIQMQPDTVTQFQDDIYAGRWDEALMLLPQLTFDAGVALQAGPATVMAFC